MKDSEADGKKRFIIKDGSTYYVTESLLSYNLKAAIDSKDEEKLRGVAKVQEFYDDLSDRADGCCDDDDGRSPPVVYMAFSAAMLDRHIRNTGE